MRQETPFKRPNRSSWLVAAAALGILLSPALSRSLPRDGKVTCRTSSVHPQAPCVPMIEMEIRDVVPIQEVNAHAVVLISKQDGALLPVFVNEAEAVSIALHLAHMSAPHALPNDLLGQAIQALGGTVTEVRLDSMQGRTYSGQVFISQGSKRLELPGNPAELLSLALSRNIKIYVSQKLISEGGISKPDVDRMRNKNSGPGVGGSGPGNSAEKSSHEVSL